MNCHICGAKTRVQRTEKGEEEVARQRVCVECDHTFATIERRAQRMWVEIPRKNGI